MSTDRFAQYAKLQSLLFDAPLAITKERAATLVQVIGPRLLGLAPTTTEEAAPILAGSPFGGGLPKLEDIEIREGVAILPVAGTFVPKADVYDSMSGMVSYSRLVSTLQALDDDPRVRGTMIGWDSPGGVVTGVIEARAAMLKLKKPYWSAVAMQMTSAAAWLGLTAKKVFISPTGSTASIGVLLVRRDESQKDEKEGVAYSFITSGEQKAYGHPHLKMSDEELASHVKRVNTIADLFFTDVHASRPQMTRKQIEGLQGRSVLGAEALSVGLADAEGSFDDAIAAMIAEFRGGSIISLGATGGTMSDKAKEGTEQPKATDQPAADAPKAPEAPKDNVIDMTKVRADAKEDFKKEEAARLKGITELCKLSKRPDLVMGFITEGKSVAEVQTALLDLDAKEQSESPLSGHSLPPGGAPTGAFNIQGFFAKRKAAVVEAQNKRAAQLR